MLSGDNHEVNPRVRGGEPTASLNQSKPRSTPPAVKGKGFAKRAGTREH